MRLILVEDDADAHDDVVEGLRPLGYEVIEAATVEVAVQLLVTCPTSALAVTDDDLGAERSRIEFGDWLHGRWPELNVIFSSGCLARLGARVFDPRETCFAKPFTVCRLIELRRDAVPLPASASDA